jgi:hypothetical protein
MSSFPGIATSATATSALAASNLAPAFFQIRAAERATASTPTASHIPKKR